ncbi:MAG: UDP-N-acetylmuramoyl-tripeptide--D-alanyl-D-alanine ligase [Clostridiaceae bacterium]|nr:UDP-N-acetylmuramoyl-tripeptide--D-alanyl-D-alanine ligase [Clostridiaceae bacterium]
MTELLLRDICRWTQARNLTGDTAEPERLISAICTDSRAVKPGCLFLALHGEHFDGHSFLLQAAAQGAGALMIDDRSVYDHLAGRDQTAETTLIAYLPVLLVNNTLQALQDIAAGYRLMLTAPVVAITGSVGKTSTRLMVSACLQTAFQVHQTAGNLNNEIGLPQTLLQAEPDDRAVVVEMGMRGPGEIAMLSRIAQPDIAMITCIGWSHIGRLGSREAILAAKSEILQGLRPGGLLVLNADDPLLRQLGMNLAGRLRVAYITCDQTALPAGSEQARQAAFIIRADQVETNGSQVSFHVHLSQMDEDEQELPVRLPFPGLHHVRNTLFGLAAAHALQLDLASAARGAAEYRNTGSRQRVLSLAGITLMDDSYNAGPESMQAALETLAGMAGSEHRKIAALGCMLELGDFAPEAHRQVGEWVARLDYQLLLVFGPNGEDILVGARSVRPDLPSCDCCDHQEMADRLMAALQPGDYLLVKGSRGFAMEHVVEKVADSLEKRPVLSCAT